MAGKKWVVGALKYGHEWEDLEKQVFLTHEGASGEVDRLNKTGVYSLVFVQDSQYFKG